MEKERLDLISTLPHEILRHIVSFLPLKAAVSTSVLSTRWKNFWGPLCVNLQFNSDQIITREASKEVTEVIGMLLRSYDSHEQWKLCLGFPKSDRESLETKDELVFLATKGVEKELHLDFSRGKQVTGNFNLKLESTRVKFWNHPTEAATFCSLKTLHLISVNHAAKDMASNLFSNCQLLESLKIEKSIGLQSLDIGAHNSLQNLTVVDCPSIIGITVSAANLKSFWYQGVLAQIQLKSVPKLADVVLNVKDGVANYEFDCEDVLSLMASLKEVEILTISGWLLLWLCSAGVIFERLEFQFNKLKELWWIDYSISGQKRDSLACFLNATPFLERLFIDIDQSCNPISTPFFHHYWHEPHLWMDYTTVKSNALHLEHLKIVTLAGFTYDEDQLLLMDLLFKKAVILNSMIVTSPDKHSWEVAKIPRSQPKQASRTYPKQIAISSPEKEYFFGFSEVNGFLCPANGRCL